MTSPVGRCYTGSGQTAKKTPSQEIFEFLHVYSFCISSSLA
jgi:hypothetical protein